MKKEVLLIGFVALLILVSGCTEPDNSQLNINGTDNGENGSQPPVTPPNDDPPDDKPLETKYGMSFETAIVSEEDNSDDGIAAEYEWLAENACIDNEGIFDIEMQELHEQDDHWYDVMHMICNNNEIEVYYFQIDSFFGIWEDDE